MHNSPIPAYHGEPCMRALTARVPKPVVRENTMKRPRTLSVSATIALGLAFFAITAGSTAKAAEIKLLSAVALQPGFIALIPDFEKSSGHKVTTTYGTAGAVADRVQKGEDADIVINSGPLIDQLQAQGKVVADSRVNIAKVGVGVFVRKGGTKPDLASDVGFKQISEVLAQPTVEFAGGLPSAIQNYTQFAAVIVSGSSQTDAGRALVTFFSSPAAQTALKAKGFE